LRRSLVVSVGVGVASVVACQLVAGIHDEDYPDPAPSPDDAGSFADAAVCGARWPAPPLSEDGTDVRSFVNVLREVGLGGRLGVDAGTSDGAPSSPNAAAGFDLDCVTTCPGPESCIAHADAGPHCDGPGGVDSEINDLFGEITGATASANPFDFQQLIDTGTVNVLFAVTGYNGGQNDKSVQVTMYFSAGPQGDAGPDGGSVLPNWDAGDGGATWTVDDRSVLDGGQGLVYVPRYVTQDAYIAGGVLVVHGDPLPIPLGLGSSYTAANVLGATVMAQVVPSGDTFALENGVIAGHVPTATLLAQLGAARDPITPSANPCDPNSVGRAFIMQYVCQGADMANVPSVGGNLSPCDSLSVSLSFRAVPAHLGVLKHVGDAGSSCPSYPDCFPDWPGVGAGDGG
jgi:hypothetical protein